MDVYLVPVGATRYELYCEVPDEPDTAGVVEPPPGFFRRMVRRFLPAFLRRMVHRFHEMIAEAERERRHGNAVSAPRGWFGRFRARTLRWVAESIAEQKLLWHLRKQDAATFHYPDDLEEGPAVAIRREQLGRDYKKHRFWLAIDSTLMVVLGVGLFFVPGPNIIGYYFAFRVVGHYLSLRGASRGLNGIVWRNEASAPLTELRRLLALDPGVREPRLHAVAEMLRLEHLVSFFERSAVST